MRSHARRVGLGRVGLESLHAVGQGVAGALVASLAVSGCADDSARLNEVREPFRVVSGVPSTESAPPRIEASDGAVSPGDFRAQRSSHCDTFQQRRSGKVDVLFVVRRSPSMDEAVSRLARAMHELFLVLSSAEPPADVHVAFTTSDFGLAPAALAGTPAFLSCGPVAGVLRCNAGGGSMDEAISWASRTLESLPVSAAPEKGLLVAAQVASRRLSTGGFLRDDAKLRVVFVSDEDDASCFPFVDPDEATDCDTSGVCRCAESLDFGATSYFARLLSGTKGFGNAGAVAVDAIVSTSADPLVRADGSGFSYVGCTTDPERACGGDGALCALHAPRYAAGADATGGKVLDYCDAAFTTSLREIGWAVSGLTREFRLSRVPIEATIETVVVPNDPVSCNDASPCPSPGQICTHEHCVTVVPPDAEDGWDHVLCAGRDARNVIRFNGRSIPSKDQTVQVCYDVDVGSELSQCR